MQDQPTDNDNELKESAYKNQQQQIQMGNNIIMTTIEQVQPSFYQKQGYIILRSLLNNVKYKILFSFTQDSDVDLIKAQFKVGRKFSLVSQIIKKCQQKIPFKEFYYFLDEDEENEKQMEYQRVVRKAKKLEQMNERTRHKIQRLQNQNR